MVPYLAVQPVFAAPLDVLTYRVVLVPPEMFVYKLPTAAAITPSGEPRPDFQITPVSGRLL